MNDFFGSPLNIGDKVAMNVNILSQNEYFNHITKNCIAFSFITANIVAITPTNLVISLTDKNGYTDEILINSKYVIKKPTM